MLEVLAACARLQINDLEIVFPQNLEKNTLAKFDHVGDKFEKNLQKLKKIIHEVKLDQTFYLKAFLQMFSNFFKCNPKSLTQLASIK